MATVLIWRGVSLEAPDVLWSSLSSGIGYGLHPVSGMPCMVFTQPAAGMLATKGGLGNLTTYSLTIKIRLTGGASGTNTLLAPQNSGGSQTWRWTLGSTGTVTLQNASNAAVSPALSYPTLSVDTDYELKMQVSGSNVTTRLYANGVEVGTAKSATGTFNALDNFRIGQTLSSPIVPVYRVWDVKITDAAEWITLPAIPTAPSKNVAVIGDSLTYMLDTGWAKFLTRATGYDPEDGAIFYYGASGKEILAADFVKRRTIEEDIAFARAQLGTVDTWIIALGTNDTGAGESTFRTRVETVLTELASENRVVWIGLAYKQESNPLLAFNTYLADEISAFPNAEYADWADYVYDPYNADDWSASDSIHMTDDGTPAEGYSRRSDYYALQLDSGTDHSGTGSLALTLGASGSARVAREGSGARTTTFTAAGIGKVAKAGTGPHAIGFAPTGTAKRTTAATATASVGFTAAGVGTVAKTASGPLNVVLSLAGDAAVAAGVAGDLGIGFVAAGDGTVSKSATGHLTIDADLTGDATVTGNSQGSGPLTTTAGMTGAATVAHTAVGALDLAGHLDGDGTVTKTTEGDLELGLAFSGDATVATAGTGVGDLTIGTLFAGTAAVQHNASGHLGIGLQATGSSLVEKTASGTLAIAIALLGGPPTGRAVTVTATLGDRRWAGGTPASQRHGGHL